MLNEKGQRELAYVVKIDEIIPIEGAERVEVAKVGGWQIMVKKGQFAVGDLAVYFEIDSKVPEKEAFMFLKDKHFKIKTQKYFKGTVISQGLLMTAEDLGWDKDALKLGEFLTEKLGVTYSVAEDNVRRHHPVISTRKWLEDILNYLEILLLSGCIRRIGARSYCIYSLAGRLIREQSGHPG